MELNGTEVWSMEQLQQNKLIESLHAKTVFLEQKKKATSQRTTNNPKRVGAHVMVGSDLSWPCLCSSHHFQWRETEVQHAGFITRSRKTASTIYLINFSFETVFKKKKNNSFTDIFDYLDVLSFDTNSHIW